MKYQIFTYDLWGNDKDGYEVNDVYPGQVIEIPDCVFNGTDRDLVHYLRRKHGAIGRFLRLWEVTGESGYDLYFSYNGKPAFELRREIN